MRLLGSFGGGNWRAMSWGARDLTFFCCHQIVVAHQSSLSWQALGRTGGWRPGVRHQAKDTIFYFLGTLLLCK